MVSLISSYSANLFANCEIEFANCNESCEQTVAIDEVLMKLIKYQPVSMRFKVGTPHALVLLTLSKPRVT